MLQIVYGIIPPPYFGQYFVSIDSVDHKFVQLVDKINYIQLTNLVIFKRAIEPSFITLRSKKHFCKSGIPSVSLFELL